MKGVVLSMNSRAREAYALGLENLSDEWRCAACGSAAEAEPLLRDADVLILGRDGAAEALLGRKRRWEPGPFLLGDGWSGSELDGSVSLASLEKLPDWLEARERAGRIPALAVARLPAMTCLARGLTHALSVPDGLRARAFLPDMTALAALHPPLTRDLRARLYPLTARRHGITPAAVERSLRLAVESAWSRGRLDALERFFGQSVDPERGKPTNKEFLLRVAQVLADAAERFR